VSTQTEDAEEVDFTLEGVKSELRGLLSSQIKVGQSFSNNNKMMNENNAGAILKLTQAVATLETQRRATREREREQ
jgi:hypothetical protein